jgi:hypothetical protein
MELIRGLGTRPRHDLRYAYVSYRWQTEAVVGCQAAALAQEICRQLQGLQAL